MCTFPGIQLRKIALGIFSTNFHYGKFMGNDLKKNCFSIFDRKFSCQIIDDGS